MPLDQSRLLAAGLRHFDALLVMSQYDIMGLEDRQRKAPSKKISLDAANKFQSDAFRNAEMRVSSI